VFSIELLYHKDSKFCPLSKVKPCLAILKTAQLPSLSNVVTSLYQLFVPCFAVAVFLCIYLHYRVNKQRDMLFELSSIFFVVPSDFFHFAYMRLSLFLSSGSVENMVCVYLFG